jgi:hypothetical protein
MSGIQDKLKQRKRKRRDENKHDCIWQENNIGTRKKRSMKSIKKRKERNKKGGMERNANQDTETQE